MDLVENHFGAEALGVRLKARHQLGALHALRVGGPVVYIGGGHQLAALGDAGDDHGVQVGAGGVNGGGVAGGAGAENNQFVVLAHDASLNGMGRKDSDGLFYYETGRLKGQ